MHTEQAGKVNLHASPHNSNGATAICHSPVHGLCILVLVRLAFLVCNAARGLASGLAGGLALATTAVVYALSEVTGLDGLNSLHDNISLHEIV